MGTPEAFQKLAGGASENILPKFWRDAFEAPSGRP
jgi:hypothetical protein